MKDLPHHIKKLNRRVIRSAQREAVEEEGVEFSSHQRPSLEQQKQKQYLQLRKEHMARTPHPLTPEQKNQKMKHRVPEFFDKNHQSIKTTRPSRKKTPKI